MCFKSAIKRLIPLFDRVLVERFAKETTTKSGIMISEKATGKVLNATVLGRARATPRESSSRAAWKPATKCCGKSTAAPLRSLFWYRRIDYFKIDFKFVNKTAKLSHRCDKSIIMKILLRQWTLNFGYRAYDLLLLQNSHFWWQRIQQNPWKKVV